jgi:hypothetical protein
MKKAALVIIAGVIVLCGGTCAYQSYALSRDKQETVAALERFYQTHAQYPGDLQELNCGYAGRFYYAADSARQSFRLLYSSGIMQCNNNIYESSTQRWRQEFVY